MGVGILAKRVVLELGLQHQLCLQSESNLGRNKVKLCYVPDCFQWWVKLRKAPGFFT